MATYGKGYFTVPEYGPYTYDHNVTVTLPVHTWVEIKNAIAAGASHHRSKGYDAYARSVDNLRDLIAAQVTTSSDWNYLEEACE